MSRGSSSLSFGLCQRKADFEFIFRKFLLSSNSSTSIKICFENDWRDLKINSSKNVVSINYVIVKRSSKISENSFLRKKISEFSSEALIVITNLGGNLRKLT